jgi:hypothetical protein
MKNREHTSHWLKRVCKKNSIDIVSEDINIQYAYMTMVFDGVKPRLAEMLAFRSFPAIRGTDSDFMKGSHIQDSKLDEYRHRMAQAEGVDTNGKRYIAGLANYPGDPEAWVSSTSDVRRICAARGWNCHGAVEFETPDSYPIVEADKPQDCPIAPDIVDAHVAARLGEFDPREVTPDMVGEIRDYETRRLSGQIDDHQLKVRAYEHDQALELTESV